MSRVERVEKQETLADIVAEMDNLGKLDEKSTDRIPRSLMGLGLRTYATRFEAAAKRELVPNRNKLGNAAAMREAALPWIAFAEWLLENAGKDALGAAIRDNGPIIRQRLEELRAALSAPPRNCDVGTPEEQRARFDKFCRSNSWDEIDGAHCMSSCPLYHGDCSRCEELEWAQMPYNKEQQNEKESQCRLWLDRNLHDLWRVSCKIS